MSDVRDCYLLLLETGERDLFGGGGDWEDWARWMKWELVFRRRKRKRLPVTLGLSRNQSAWRIKGNQTTFDNSQQNNLRSFLWVFSRVVFGLPSLSLWRERPAYISERLGETW